MNCRTVICDFVHAVFDPTTDVELERQMMDVNEPKSEREDWAYREIVKLRTEIEQHKILDFALVNWLSK
jgi:hypothetical protein